MDDERPKDVSRLEESLKLLSGIVNKTPSIDRARDLVMSELNYLREDIRLSKEGY